MLKLFIKETIKTLWFLRGRIPFLDFPFPWKLPYGGFAWVYPDVMGLTIIRGYGHEGGIWRYLKSRVNESHLCIDVGSNQGFYSILFARLGARVIAFEPVVSETMKLKKNLRLNGLKDYQKIQVYPLALTSEKPLSGWKDFFECSKEFSSRGSFEPPPEEVSGIYNRIRVEVETLDNFISEENPKSVDFLKIDTEGADLEVLKGARDMISIYQPVIIAEVADIVTRQFGYDSQDIIDFLTDSPRNYRPYQVSSKGELIPDNESKDWRRDTLLFLPPNDPLDREIAV